MSVAPASLDVSRLAKVKHRGGKLIAQCPACAAGGADRTGEHLVIFDEGRGKWGCVAFPGDKEHRRQIAELTGMDNGFAAPFLRPIATPAKARRLDLPALRVPTVGELAQLCANRGLPFFAGCEMAVRAGVLRFAEMPDAGEIVTAWLLLDSANISAQARRLDGQQWRGIEAKAKTLPGSQAAWPIGCAEIGAKPFVALCEGGPDTLAAWSIAWWHGKAQEIAPVCMAGAGLSIHADALALFEGKGVWLFPHRDNEGERAQRRWTAQLIEAGAKWARPFDVSPHKDLNDWIAALATKLDDDT